MKNEITSYIHCTHCVNDIKAIIARTGQDQSPMTYQRLEVGYTPVGLQIWCRRHQRNVVLINFEGHKHPADTAP